MMPAKKQLLVIYQDSKIPDLKELKNLFEIIVVPKINKKINFKNYKLEGNLLFSKYNEIIFSTESENIFFICSSELKKVTSNLLNFNLEKDFSYFSEKKTGNLLENISGIAVKRNVLIKIGCFDKYVFHNLFLNFLVNYSRFFPERNFLFPEIKLNIQDYAKFLFWNYFENRLYSRQPLQKGYYSLISEKFFQKKPINRIMNFSIPKIMDHFCLKINKFVDCNNYIEYW